jgi:vibriolysin
LSESFSDAMGATAERLVGRKSSFGVWRYGEEVTYSGAGSRDLADPTLFLNPLTNEPTPDHYADRYRWPGTEEWDNGGVHFNSGISNKAFYLMTVGGRHPKSDVLVPALREDFDTSIMLAASIYFYAIRACMSPSSGFLDMRRCTVMFSSDYVLRNVVQKAWDAVGVKEVLTLSNGVRIHGLALSFNHDVQAYKLYTIRPLRAGDKVTCDLQGPNGNADLFIRFGSLPYSWDRVDLNDCRSVLSGSVENCTAIAPPWDYSEAYVMVEAYSAASGLSLMCVVNGCHPLDDACTSSSECCYPFSCDQDTMTCRDCRDIGGSCPDSSYCCSNLLCVRGTCSDCLRIGSLCQDSSKCCSDLT